MGSFDGLHSGHRVLLEKVRQRAAVLQGESVVLTFDPHPRYVLGTGEGMQLLTTLEEKIWLMEQAGIDNLIVIPFTLEFSRKSPQEFIGELYGIGIRSMVVGYNHRFGHKKEGDYNYLHAHGGDLEITMVEQQQVANSKVSSTIIRQNVARGLMQRVEQMLTRPYIIIGSVEQGNLLRNIPDVKILPPAGEYIALIDGVESEIEITQEREIKLGKTTAADNVVVEITQSK